MASDPALVAHCLELLAALGTPRARRMFGGHGFYVDGLFVAILAEDSLYLKADAEAQPAFQSAGSRPFSYAGPGGQRQVMAYWSAPDDAMDRPAGMLPWARLALASALRAAAGKASPAKRPPRAKPAQAGTGRGSPR
jgi:DNA transformation protein and related proteins